MGKTQAVWKLRPPLYIKVKPSHEVNMFVPMTFNDKAYVLTFSLDLGRNCSVILIGIPSSTRWVATIYNIK